MIFDKALSIPDRLRPAGSLFIHDIHNSSLNSLTI